MRVVDYLQNDPAVDKTKIIITGTSRIGKAAMISGAFDDRIALVAPGASSGLGTPAYRFSGDGRGGREGLTMMVRKYGNQFSPHLHQFWGQEDKLPYDAHWFPALTAAAVDRARRHARHERRSQRREANVPRRPARVCFSRRHRQDRRVLV